MKLSKEQLLKLHENFALKFELDNYFGQPWDVFTSIENIVVEVQMDYFEDQVDIDAKISFCANLLDVNNNNVVKKDFLIERYFVISDKTYEADYNVYAFEKNTLNFEPIIQEEIYYSLPQNFSEVESDLIDEDEFYYQEYLKLKQDSSSSEEDQIKNPELLKLKSIFDKS